MALTDRNRSILYQSLSVVVDDEQAVQEMLSNFPAREEDQPATKDFVRAEIAISAAELRTEISKLGTDLRAEMTKLGTELRAEMTKLGTELRAEIAALRIEMHGGFRRQTLWLTGVLVAWTSVLAAILHH